MYAHVVESKKIMRNICKVILYKKKKTVKKQSFELFPILSVGRYTYKLKSAKKPQYNLSLKKPINVLSQGTPKKPRVRENSQIRGDALKN